MDQQNNIKGLFVLGAPATGKTTTCLYLEKKIRPNLSKGVRYFSDSLIFRELIHQDSPELDLFENKNDNILIKDRELYYSIVFKLLNSKIVQAISQNEFFLVEYSHPKWFLTLKYFSRLAIKSSGFILIYSRIKDTLRRNLSRSIVEKVPESFINIFPKQKINNDLALMKKTNFSNMWSIHNNGSMSELYFQLDNIIEDIHIMA